MKFDFDTAAAQTIVNLMQAAHAPHTVSDPLIREFVRQTTDPRIQSLAYPQEPKAAVGNLQGHLPDRPDNPPTPLPFAGNPQEQKPRRKLPATIMEAEAELANAEAAWSEQTRQAKAGGE